MARQYARRIGGSRVACASQDQRARKARLTQQAKAFQQLVRFRLEIDEEEDSILERAKLFEKRPGGSEKSGNQRAQRLKAAWRLRAREHDRK